MSSQRPRGVGGWALLLAVALLGSASGCLWGGGELDYDHCEIEVVSVEQWRVHDAGVDAAYKVQGRAGSAATTWLAAKTPSGDYVSGYGVDVGPGPFAAVIDLQLTGMPASFVAILEIPGAPRCRAEAKKP